MHKIGIFSDPHIGLIRRSHTTAGSRKNLTAVITDQAYEASLSLSLDSEVVLCCGDLFDKSHNDEATILAAHNIANNCDLILGGNHDVANREDTNCSIELVSRLLPDVEIVIPNVGKINYSVMVDDSNTTIISIPHQSSQELFDEVIDKVSKTEETDELKIVIMHCNYECGYADNEISLNLTSAQADKLLDRFDYIFIGHEHEPRVLKDGRLIITGNTYPTSFSDISDKFIWYVTKDNEIEKTKIWDKDSGYCKFDIKSQQSPVKSDDYKFISVEGSLTSEEYADVADYMVKLWKANPQALMIRNNIEVIVNDEVANVGLTEIDNLPAHISEELKNDDTLRATWEGYLNRI